MSFTDSFETTVLQWAMTTDAVTRPAAWYVGLFTSDPTETGAAGTEVSGGSYARQAVTFTVAGNLATNSAAVEFPPATGSWGTISHAAIFTAASGGTPIWYGGLATSKVIDTGDVFRMPAGDIDFTLN